MTFTRRRNRTATGRDLIVLQSFPVPRPTTNPYLIMLGRQLQETSGVAVVNWSFKNALLRRYDVFHVHWPEIIVNGHTPLKKAIRQMLVVLLLLRWKLLRTPVVRTAHNVERPSDIGLRERLLLDGIDAATTLWIRLNNTTTVHGDEPCETIPHGHYRQWFEPYPQSSPTAGQLGYVGLIRRYKGVEGLLDAFLDTKGLATGADLTLWIGGQPSTEDLRQTIRGQAAADQRVRLNDQFLTDAQLVEIVTSSSLLVLPYRFMHNSGGVLAGLSLGRPVLVPDNVVNRDLAAEVGPDWIHFFEGELMASDLLRAYEAAAPPPPRAPDLSRREWPDATQAHLSAYRRALAIKRPSAAGSAVNS